MSFIVETINICGINRNAEKTALKARVLYLLQYLENSQPDIICFQEISYYCWLKISDFAAKYDYYVIPYLYKWDHQFDDHIITMILSKLKPQESEIFRLPNERQLDYYLTLAKVDNIYVGNMHLYHGKNNADIRKNHLNYMDTIISQRVPKNCMLILAGDFNFDLDKSDSISSDDHFNKLIIKNRLLLEDIWSLLRPNDIGFTQDPTVNTLRKKTSKTKECRRIDGIFCRALKGICPIKIDLSITNPVCVDKSEDIFISDHYGVKCTFCITFR
jgi:exonuclease III